MRHTRSPVQVATMDHFFLGTVAEPWCGLCVVIVLPYFVFVDVSEILLISVGGILVHFAHILQPNE